MSYAYSPLLKQLIGALQCLPGVGAKSAQRMAFHLLHRDREGARVLAEMLERASRDIKHCRNCRMLTEESVCALCANERRNGALLCIVEMPADVIAIEHSASYDGRYFVLMGHMSPLDGIGPDELGIDLLEDRFKNESIDEVVLATSVTVEGDATADLIAALASRYGIQATRIAYGVPMGGELEFVDSGTLSRALKGRRAVEIEPTEDVV